MAAMERRHLSRPVYEGLPWFYMAFGLVALIASYLLASHGVVSLMVGLPGLVALVYGIVVLLRRRDYRALRSEYGQPDSLSDKDSPAP
jgi:membrane associated rhomboid family serine protease